MPIYSTRLTRLTCVNMSCLFTSPECPSVNTIAPTIANSNIYPARIRNIPRSSKRRSPNIVRLGVGDIFVNEFILKSV